MSHEVPGTAEMRRTEAAQEVLQRRLWSLAGQALDDAPGRERARASTWTASTR